MGRTPDSSNSSPAPVRVPSHSRQSSKNYSSVFCLQRLQLLMNCSNMGAMRCSPSGTDQCRSPMRSQVLPANLLHQARGSAPGQASHLVRVVFRNFPDLALGPLWHWHWLQVGEWMSTPRWSSMGCRGTAVSPGQSQLQHLEHPLPLLLH